MTLILNVSSHKSKYIVLHASLGLGNRIRALLSALDLARKSGRELKLVWETDVHVQCAFLDLFKANFITPRDVFESNTSFAINDEAYDVYDYTGSAKNKLVDFASPRDIYIKTAFRINSTVKSYWSRYDEDKLIHELQPNAVSAAIVSHFKRRLGAQYVGVHIRNSGPREELHNLPSNQYTKEEYDTLVKHRRACNVSAFIDILSQPAYAEPGTAIFVAADKVKNIQELKAHISAPIYWLDNGACLDRSCSCLRFAIADMWVLGSSSTIIGSFWSSFTEMAAVLAGVNPVFVGTKG